MRSSPPNVNAPPKKNYPRPQPYVYMSLYAADRRHFTADISARLYSPAPYYAAKTLAVLPFALANVLVRAPPFFVAVVGWWLVVGGWW